MERKTVTEKDSKEKKEWSLPGVKEVGLPVTDGKSPNNAYEQTTACGSCGPS